MCNDPNCPDRPRLAKDQLLHVLGLVLPKLSNTDAARLTTFLVNQAESDIPNVESRLLSVVHEALNTAYSATGTTKAEQLHIAHHHIVDIWAIKFASLVRDKGVLVLSAQFWDTFGQEHTCRMTDKQRRALFLEALINGGYTGHDWTSFHAVAFPFHEGDDWYAAFVSRNQVTLFDATGQTNKDSDHTKAIAGYIGSYFRFGQPAGVKAACLASDDDGEDRMLLHFGFAPNLIHARHSAVLALMAVDIWANFLASGLTDRLHAWGGLLPMLSQTTELFAAEAAQVEGKPEEPMSRETYISALIKKLFKKPAKEGAKQWTKPVMGTEKAMLDRVAWVCYTGENAGQHPNPVDNSHGERKVDNDSGGKSEGEGDNGVEIAAKNDHAANEVDADADGNVQAKVDDEADVEGKGAVEA